MNNSMYRALVAILKIVTIGVVGSSCSHDSEMAPTGGVAVPSLPMSEGEPVAVDSPEGMATGIAGENQTKGQVQPQTVPYSSPKQLFIAAPNLARLLYT